MLLRLCLPILCLGLIVHISGKELMCYFCSDTSAEDKDNDCQTWYRTMKYYRQKFEDTGKYTTDKYVKNCTGFGQTDNGNADVHCMIAYIKQGGNVQSFIRDCSIENQFFTEEINKLFNDNAVTNDNQTSCKYTGQGYLACVTLCGSTADQLFEYDHFCNGPVLSAAAEKFSIMAVFTVILITTLGRFVL